MNERLTRALDESLPPGVAEASLARTLGAVRRRRMRQQGLTLAGIAGVVVVGVLMWNRPDPPAGSEIAAVTPATQMKDPPRIQIREISDAQLLALFPGQAAGFATVNGRREFILLPTESDGGE